LKLTTETELDRPRTGIRACLRDVDRKRYPRRAGKEEISGSYNDESENNVRRREKEEEKLESKNRIMHRCTKNTKKPDEVGRKMKKERVLT